MNPDVLGQWGTAWPGVFLESAMWVSWGNHRECGPHNGPLFLQRLWGQGWAQQTWWPQLEPGHGSRVWVSPALLLWGREPTPEGKRGRQGGGGLCDRGIHFGWGGQAGGPGGPLCWGRAWALPGGWGSLRALPRSPHHHHLVNTHFPVRFYRVPISKMQH